MVDTSNMIVFEELEQLRNEAYMPHLYTDVEDTGSAEYTLFSHRA